MRGRPWIRGAGIALGALVALVVFRAFLLPHTLPAGFDRWADIEDFHLGARAVYGAGAAACLLAAAVWAVYYPLVRNSAGPFGLWLTTGGWLAFTIVTLLLSTARPQLIAREWPILLGYAGGLAAARALPRVRVFLTALVACGAVQSVLAIALYARGIHVMVSGSVARAGGTFDTPSVLYLVPLFILPLAVQRVLSPSTQADQVFHMVCAACLFAALLLTWERSAFVAVCVGMLWLVRNYLPAGRRAVGVTVAAIAVCGVFFVRSHGPLNYASSMRSIHSRADLVGAGSLIFGRHWLSGVGLGWLTVPVETTVHGQAEKVYLLDPSNQYLFWLDEMGVFGAVLIVLFAVFIFRSLAGAPAPFGRGITAVWICVLVAGMFNTLFGCYAGSCGNMLTGSLLGVTLRLGSAAIVC